MNVKWSAGQILLVVLLLVALYFTLAKLSGVLIPFALAWLFAYVLNPIVNFFQKTCRLRFRIVAVLLTICIALGVLSVLFFLVVPPLLKECTHFDVVLNRYYQNRAENPTIPVMIQEYIDNNINVYEIIGSDLTTAIKNLAPKLLSFAYSTASVLFRMAASLICLLYLFFLMMDYDHYARIWIKYVPNKYKNFAHRFMNDVERYVGGYFRGQFFIAISNCIMFCLGLWLIDFPMPVALGCFIGIISFVPYLQVVGLIPATLLALLRAADSGQNFWLLMAGVIGVYIVVQIIQDVLVTPRVMGKIMGLSPAVILLSLSIGAALFGVTGLILALPVTTMSLLYYRRYILHETAEKLG